MNSLDIADRVNTEVNQMIRYCTDVEQYQEGEYWCIPKGTLGDCEDYVLLKRKKLIDKGWDLDKINIVTCINSRGEGHAVLYVQTDHGGFLLDNCNISPMDPKHTNYTWKEILRDGEWYELLGF